MKQLDSNNMRVTQEHREIENAQKNADCIEHFGKCRIIMNAIRRNQAKHPIVRFWTTHTIGLCFLRHSLYVYVELYIICVQYIKLQLTQIFLNDMKRRIANCCQITYIENVVLPTLLKTNQMWKTEQYEKGKNVRNERKTCQSFGCIEKNRFYLGFFFVW